jgi:hypothetical protein
MSTSPTTLLITVPSHGLIVGNQVFIEGVQGCGGALNNNIFTVVTVPTGDTFTISAVINYSYQTGGRIHKMVNSVSGPSYLNGQPVSVVVNGKTLYTLNYNNGVSLPVPAWNVVIGLPYQWQLKFLPLGGDGQTVNQGRKRKIYDIVLRIWKSLGGQVSTDGNNLFNINYTAVENINRNTDDNVLFTGDLHAVGFESKVDDYATPVISGTSGLPFMLLAAIMRSEIFEDK